MANRIQLRRDTAANWTRVNPVLEDGEPGLEIDTNYIKYGDGNTAWADLAYASTGGGGGSGNVSFAYSTVQEGAAGGNVTSITGGNNTGISLTSEQWAQLMWVPNTANVTIADIGDGPARYNWVYVDEDGFRVESNLANVRSTWTFHANSLLTTPGNVQVGNVGSYGSISFVDTISANNYVFANGISILTGISGNTGNITFDGIKIVGANIGNGSGDIKLVPDNTGDFYANGQYVHIYPTRAVPDSPHIHIDSGYGGDLIIGNDERGVDINHDANVYIRTDQYAGAYNWRFGSNGNLTLPNGTSIDAMEDGYGIGLTTDRGTILFGNRPEIGQPNHFHIMKANTAAVDLFFGDDSDYVRLPGIGNVEIGAGGSAWTFGSNSNLSLPYGVGVIGSIETTDSVDLYGDSGSQYVQINWNNQNFVYVDSTGAHMQAGPSAPGEYEIVLSTDGSTTFPDHKPVSITGNLTVGNLTVTGNSTVINTESYIVSDNIIQMANANPADLLDLGFVAHRTVGGILQHTGLIRDAGTDAWRLFSNVTAQPGNTVDFTDVVYDSLQVGGFESSSVTLTGPINFTASPPAYSTPGIQWNSGWQGDIYGDSQVATYLSAYTGSIGNLRVTNTYTPVTAGGNVGDLHGQIRIDSDYLHVTAGAYGQQSYTVKAFANHVFASQYYIALAKGAYPKPQNGWEITRDGWGTYFALDAEPVDYGTYWWCSIAGYSGSYPAWAEGDNVVLRGTTSTVWKSVPLNTFKTPAYGNTQVAAYLLENPQGSGTYSNANVVANLQNFVTSISTTANVTTTANVIAPNFLFANGVNILSTVSGGGGSYANADVAAYLAANTAVYLGNPGVRYPNQANVTQTFIGNTTTIGAGSNQLGGTYILNNAYFGANGAMYARNTQTGAAQFSISGGSFSWAGTTGAVTANAYQSFGLWASLSSTGLSTSNSLGITSAGVLTASGGLILNSNASIVTNQATASIFNTTATTINFVGAATTITTGASSANLVVGTSAGLGNVFARNLNGTHYGNAIGTTATYSGNISVGNLTASSNITVGNLITSGTYGNITGANVISANTFVGTSAVISGNVSALNFTGNGYQLTSVATKVSGSWTLAAGSNTVNITVPGPGTYALWVNGNIPNGICTYTATVVVTNTNVPVLGGQYAWYYAAGNMLVITAIPAHIVGTEGSIITTAPSTTTAYVFEFGITNNSGASCTVDYGYTKLS
jgi:hypothetical protein